MPESPKHTVMVLRPMVSSVEGLQQLTPRKPNREHHNQ